MIRILFVVAFALAIEPRIVRPQESASRIEVEGAILKTIEATTLAAQLSGVVHELNVKEGDAVETGQLLGKIQDDAIQLKLEQLQTRIEMAEKKYANDINKRLAEKSMQVAENEYQRALNANMRVPDTYPLNEIERLKLIADQARLEVERAEYEREMAELEVAVARSDYRQTLEIFSRHKISAPASGVVVSVQKRIGEWVDPGSDLLRIVRIDQLRVEGFITASQAMENLVGRTATVQLIRTQRESEGDSTGKPMSIPGKVVFVSPDINPANSQARVFIEVDNPHSMLRPGLRVKVLINLSE